MLGTLAPAVHVHAIFNGIPSDAAFVHIHTVEVMADVTIEPGRAGRTDVTIRVSRENSSYYPAKDVQFGARSPNHWRGERSDAPLSRKRMAVGWSMT